MKRPDRLQPTAYMVNCERCGGISRNSGGPSLKEMARRHIRSLVLLIHRSLGRRDGILRGHPADRDLDHI